VSGVRAQDAFLRDAERLPTLGTPRLRLRPVVPGDAPDLFAVFGDPVVCRYWSRPALPDLAAAESLQREIAALFAERSLFQWAIADRATDRLVGTCTLAELSAEHRRAAVGYALRRAEWGRGYGTEALRALLAFAFDDAAGLALHRVEADVDPRNDASIRVLERLGFRREGVLRERWHLHGELQDAALYGLLAREWRAAPGGRILGDRASADPAPAVARDPSTPPVT
jgi:RimJ/RimL family protein N-acetyltransferase